MNEFESMVRLNARLYPDKYPAIARELEDEDERAAAQADVDADRAARATTASYVAREFGRGAC